MKRRIGIIGLITAGICVLLTLSSLTGCKSMKKNLPSDWRSSLPEPVLGQHKEWVDFYYETWRIADTKKVEYQGQTLFDTAFKPGKIWMWDTVWISHFGIYVQDANPPITNPMHGYDLFYSAQREDGCIPHVWNVTGEHSFKVHNPIFTLGELNYYRHTGDKSRLARVVPILDRFYFYLKGFYGEPDGLYRNFDWHNGMDNRPMADISIDSTCEQAMVAAQLKQMAGLIGDDERAAKFGKEYDVLKKRINESMWRPADQFYTDLSSNRMPVNVWSVASYWALIAGVADAKQAASMKAHLFDEENFKTPFMVPTLGRKSPGYDGDGGMYWRGAVWVPTSTMVIKGLKKYGYVDAAREIAINGLEGMVATWRETGTLWENYDQEHPGKRGERSRPDFVGWSGVQPIATLIETIIGIEVDAPNNQINWTLRMTEQNGVRNLKWGKNYSRKVDLVADARASADDAVTLHVSSDAPFTLVVDTGFAKKEIAVRKGRNQTFVVQPGRLTAAEKDVVVGNIRLQFLSDSIVRVEEMGPKGFEDRPTFYIVNRDFPGTDYSVTKKDGKTVYTTANYQVIVDNAIAGLNGVQVKDSSGKMTWVIKDTMAADQQFRADLIHTDMKSTRFYTRDLRAELKFITDDGKIRNLTESRFPFIPFPAEPDVSYCIGDMPRLIPSQVGITPAASRGEFAEDSGWDLSNQANDMYFIFPGGTSRKHIEILVDDILQLTGPAVMPPLKVLGTIDSRFYSYKDSDVIHVIDGYLNRSIPIDCKVVDTVWHNHKPTRWEYSVDENFSTNMAALLDECHRRNIEVFLNDHPQPVGPTALSPEELNFRYASLTGLFDQGLDYWWYDKNMWSGLQQPAPGLFRAIWGTALFHDVAKRYNPNKRPLVLSALDIASSPPKGGPYTQIWQKELMPNIAFHRYPITWDGDTKEGWEVNQTELRRTVLFGHGGLVPYLSTDLGGHKPTYPDPENYIRFMQFGALSPIVRPHPWSRYGVAMYPFAFNDEVTQIVGDYLRLRYRIMPMIYAASRRVYETGKPLVERLDWYYPEEQAATEMDQYLFCQSLLVAPITAPARPPFEEVSSEYLTGKTIGPMPESGVYAFCLKDENIDQTFKLTIDGNQVAAWDVLQNAMGSIALKKGETYTCEYKGTLMWQLPHEEVPAVRTVWMPPGQWVDLFTGERLEGPKKVNVKSAIWEMPLYAQTGTPLITVPDRLQTTESPWSKVVIDTFVSGEALSTERMLYEDDTASVAYLNDEYCKTRISVEQAANRISLHIAAKAGSYTGALNSRTWIARFRMPKGTANYKSIELNGIPVSKSDVVIIQPLKSSSNIVLAGEGSQPAMQEGVTIEVKLDQVSTASENNIVLTY